MLHANQLQFNLNVPVNPENLRTGFTSPSPIMHERVMPANRSPVSKQKAPFEFKSVSSDKLSRAILLAKRDLKLAKRQKSLQNFANENDLSYNEPHVPREMDGHKPRGDINASVCFVPSPEQKRSKHTERDKKGIKAKIAIPKTTAPNKEQQEKLDIRRLRLEQQQLILTLERNHEDKRILHQKNLLMLDQEEEQKLVVRHLEQMRKSSRTVYTLQQQVQAIKGDLKRGFKQENRTLSKAAAAHRGALRLLQAYCPQLPEHLIFSDNFVAVNALFQEVSRLVKELSLCALQLGLADIEEVERLTEALKNIEPKRVVPSRPTTSAPGRNVKTPNRKPKTPNRSFKSKDVKLVKKSFAQPKIPRPSFATPSREGRRVKGETQATDLIDRPEWRPPSNSPYKDVGPPSLGPLLESPSPVPQRQQTKSKEVKFFSTPKVPEEHDIDLFEDKTPRDIKMLKAKLADELEAELKNRIEPLLKKVDDLARSSQKNRSGSSHHSIQNDIVENQIRNLVAETKREMLSFQHEQEIEQEAVELQQRPSLESLLNRLNTISQEEEAIRRRWQEINYEDLRSDQASLSVEAVPKTPQAFKFTKSTSDQRTESPPKRVVNFIANEDQEDNPLPFFINKKTSKEKFSGTMLNLPQSTVNAIERGKSRFTRHLKHSFHERKGNFDPWLMVEELSDEIMEDVMTKVSEEADRICQEYADEIFQGEFADSSGLTDSSFMVSSDSSILQTPKYK